jgi:hypothetical protein
MFINEGQVRRGLSLKAVIEHMRHFTGVIRHLQCTIGFKSQRFDKINCENSFLEDINKSNLPFIDKHLLLLQ